MINLNKIDEIMERMAGDWKERTAIEKQQILDELSPLLLSQILTEVLPEEGIQWMQEGSHKDKKGFTEGFNKCREMVKSNIMNLMKEETNNKKELRKIIEQFENGLCKAGLNPDNVDYDILAEVRTKCWKDLEDLLTNK